MKGFKVKKNFQCVSKLHSVIKQDPDIYMVEKNSICFDKHSENTRRIFRVIPFFKLRNTVSK